MEDWGRTLHTRGSVGSDSDYDHTKDKEHGLEEKLRSKEWVWTIPSTHWFPMTASTSQGNKSQTFGISFYFKHENPYFKWVQLLETVYLFDWNTSISLSKCTYICLQPTSVVVSLLIALPFNTVPCVMVTPNYKTIFILCIWAHHNFDFATVVTLSIGYIGYLTGDPYERVIHFQRGWESLTSILGLASTASSLFRRGIQHRLSPSHNSMFLALNQSFWQRRFNLPFSHTQLDSATPLTGVRVESEIQILP